MIAKEKPYDWADEARDGDAVGCGFILLVWALVAIVLFVVITLAS